MYQLLSTIYLNKNVSNTIEVGAGEFLNSLKMD